MKNDRLLTTIELIILLILIILGTLFLGERNEQIERGNFTIISDSEMDK